MWLTRWASTRGWRKWRRSCASVSGRAKSKCKVLGPQTLDTLGEQAWAGVVRQSRGRWSRRGQNRSWVGGESAIWKAYRSLYIPFCLTYCVSGASLYSKESACNAEDLGSIPGLMIPWRRAWQPSPLFLPGEFHGQRSLAGHSPWGRKESDTTEWQSTHELW